MELYDPCCGSGGVFIQCAKYVEAKQGDIKMVNVYGQRDPTYRLAKMNLAKWYLTSPWGNKMPLLFAGFTYKGLTFLILLWQIRLLI
jgi:type I restriction enzyme M protein